MQDIEEQYLQWLYYIYVQAISIIIYKSLFFHEPGKRNKVASNNAVQSKVQHVLPYLQYTPNIVLSSSSTANAQTYSRSIKSDRKIHPFALVISKITANYKQKGGFFSLSPIKS